MSSFRCRCLTITVEVPSLDKLVGYLEAERKSQQEIDRLAQEVGALAKQLEQSQKGLAGAIKPLPKE